MKFVKVWKDSRPEKGEDMTEDIEEEEETEDRLLWEGGGADKLRPCERSTPFICADGWEVLMRLTTGAAGCATCSSGDE